MSSIRIGFTVLAAAFLIPTSSLVAAGNIQPNIVFIFADDWGWGDLSCHGNQDFPTPNIDRLAAQETDCHQFTFNSPVCSPSRTALMTGHFPGRYNILQHFASLEHHKKYNMPDWLNSVAPMMPRMLQQAGYITAHFGKWHLTNRNVSDAPLPTEYGYDEYGAFNLPGPQIKVGTSCDNAVDFVRRHQDRPFFINLWNHETHAPHYPEKKTLKRFSHLDEQHQVYAAIAADGDERIGRVMLLNQQLVRAELIYI